MSLDARGWDPRQYLKYGGLRLRPALDLLAAIDLENPATIVDLGCGPGNLRPALHDRWPGARYLGVDRSATMLEAARREHPDQEWLEADAASWHPDTAVDLIFSNAALHWLPDHGALFPRLVEMLSPGGILACQMPRNHAASSHVLIRESVESGPWRSRLEPLLRPAPVARPEVYYDILKPRVTELDIWETDYLQTLEGENAVAEWVKGSALKPLLDALPDPEEQAEFYRDYCRRIARAYPRRDDGITIFPFRRQFIVARR